MNIVLVSCVVSAIIVYFLPSNQKRMGWITLGLLSTVAIYREYILAYWIMNCTIFFIACLIDRLCSGKERVRWLISCLEIVIFVSIFLIGRCYQWIILALDCGHVSLHFYYLDMIFALRLITFLYEVGSKQVRNLSISNYIVWASMPFTLFGPLLRYSEFEQQFSEINERGTISDCFTKGWWLKLFLALSQLGLAVILDYFSSLLENAGHHIGSTLLITFFLAPWAFYLMSSGYAEMMQCLGYFWGISIPCNYNSPFGRANLSEFWANWNMTATAVFRDYLFYNRWGIFQQVPLYLNSIVVFICVGIWHDLNWYWFLWGLCHGIGFAMFICYHKNWGTKTYGLPKILLSSFSGLITYIFVCSCWIIPSQILKFLK